MNDELWTRASELFAKAIELPSDQVAAFIAKNCHDDPQLAAEVRKMLSEDAEATNAGFLSPAFTTPFAASKSRSAGSAANPLAGFPVVDPQLDAARLIGRDLGPYRIERLIGHGGMGSIYLAVRKTDFSSQVAVKLIRHGTNSEIVLARFQHEIQLQAALGRHPNIAGILDAGQTDEGAPYFVMEYVDGQPIDAFCNNNQLSIDQRLALFAEVCAAVQFAHQNTVIHRDLKPSNILVTDEGRPVLIDFGIAKVLAIDSGSTTVVSDFTQTGSNVFTPSYASPEQFQSNSLTTATDVYSLGVILYELLAGCPPYRIQLRDLSQIVDAIVHQDPPLPSRAAAIEDEESDTGHNETSISERSQQRSTTPQRLQQKLAGELDDIVMMALRKAPERRYATASALESDVRNYLSGHPVSAKPDTLAYRSSKFVQRNRGLVAVAIAGIISLLAGTTGTTVGLLRAKAEGRRAEANAVQAEKERQAAIKQEKHAIEQQRLAEASEKEAREVVRDFYVRIGANSLFNTSSLQPLRLEFLEAALEFVEKKYAANPNDIANQVELGELLFRTATARDALGDHLGMSRAMERSIEILESVLNTHSDSETTNIASFRLHATRELGKAYFLQATMLARTGYGMEALKSFERAEENLKRATEKAAEPIPIQIDLAELYTALGYHWTMSPTPEKCQDYYQRAFELRQAIAAASDTDSSRYALARSYSDLGYAIRLTIDETRGSERLSRIAAATEHYQASSEILQPLIEQNPTAYDYLDTLAEVQTSLAFASRLKNEFTGLTDSEQEENHKQALEQFQQALDIRKKLHSLNPSLAKFAHRLAQSYDQVGMQLRVLGQQESALTSYQQSVQLRRNLYASLANDVRYGSGLASSLNNMSLVYIDLEEFEKAEACLSEAIALQETMTQRVPILRNHAALANQLMSLSIVKRRTASFDSSRELLMRAKEVSPGSPRQILTLARHQAFLFNAATEAGISGTQLQRFADEAVDTIVQNLDNHKLSLADLRDVAFDGLQHHERFPQLEMAQ